MTIRSYRAGNLILEALAIRASNLKKALARTGFHSPKNSIEHTLCTYVFLASLFIVRQTSHRKRERVHFLIVCMLVVCTSSLLFAFNSHYCCTKSTYFWG